MAKGHLEIIECPECSARQEAIVEHFGIFDSYVHDCEECGYTILESEWNTIKTLDAKVEGVTAIL